MEKIKYTLYNKGWIIEKVIPSFFVRGDRMMNINRLIKNVIEQIKEAQLKLGFEREVIRLYFPVSSLNALLETDYQDEKQMLTVLRETEELQNTEMGSLAFSAHKGRIEIMVSPKGAEYVAKKVPDPVFLKAVIELFASNHSLTIEEICQCFEQSGREYTCEEMAPGTDFDYVVYFKDASFDEYYYCIKMEMGHTIYHRFMKEDYLLLIEE